MNILMLIDKLNASLQIIDQGQAKDVDSPYYFNNIPFEIPRKYFNLIQILESFCYL